MDQVCLVCASSESVQILNSSSDLKWNISDCFGENASGKVSPSHLGMTDLGRMRTGKWERTSMCCPFSSFSLCYSLGDHRNKETKVRNVYGEPAPGQALHQVSRFNSRKNLQHGFIFSISQGKIWSSERVKDLPRVMWPRWYAQTGWKGQALSCTAQNRRDTGTQSPMAPSDTCLSLLHSHQCRLHTPQKCAFWIQLIIYNAVI